MTKELFTAEEYDKGLVITLVREANTILASLNENDAKYKYMYYRYKECIDIMRAIERTEPQRDEDVDFILNTINTIWNKGVLSPLTLNDDEFAAPNEMGVCHNIRYNHICKFKGKIYNSNAFKCTIRAQYNHENKVQIPISFDTYSQNPMIFLSKGGVITGEYIDTCFIRPDIIEKHCYTIQSIVNIPACVIESKEATILAVDHREPKLKALMGFYDCPISVSDTVKELKFNIRNYKKLKI